MRSITNLLTSAVISLALILFVFTSHVRAADLLNRSLKIGTSTPSATTTYNFTFDIGTSSSVGSMTIEFCFNSPLFSHPCNAPAGFNASAATLSSQSGEVGFSIYPSSTANRLVLTRAPSLASLVTAHYNFSNIVNPSTVGTTYSKVATYASTDGSGSRIDSGGLAFATAKGVAVKSYVPPYLTFCVGVTVALDCSTAGGEFLGFGELSSSQTKYMTSQYSGATNDPGGYSTSLTGITMTSGSNFIPALTLPTSSQVGVSQFGMNLRANSSPGVGNDPSGIGSSQISSDYATANQFTFKNQVLSYSNTSTNFNLFTVSYIVNITSSQPAGIYNTTLTYIATAAF